MDIHRTIVLNVLWKKRLGEMILRLWIMDLRVRFVFKKVSLLKLDLDVVIGFS